MRTNLDVAHVGYVELFSPRPDESLRFFTELLSLVESGRDGNSVYLRAFDDYDAFADSDGHELDLYDETEWHRPPAELQPALKNQGHHRPRHGLGVRRIDHVDYLARQVEPSRDVCRDLLGARPIEQIVLDDGTIAGAWLSVTNKGYDLVYTRDHMQAPARLHHVAFAVDQREDILRGADLVLEDGIHIETGPHKHAIQQTFFLYVLEPGLNRIEIVNAGARLVLAPDWPVITWTEAERAKGQAWGLQTISTFHTHGTPRVGEDEPAPAGSQTVRGSR